jgi:hypothetical protein
MSKRWLKAGIIVGVLALAGVAATAPKKGTKIKVRVPSAKLMKEPKFVGASVGTLARGDEVVFVEAKGEFYRVTAGAGEGYLAKNQVTDKEVKASSGAGSSGGGASQEEVELAARGFSRQVEDSYRKKHGNLDFSHIEAISLVGPDLEAEATFLADGRLGGGK